MRWVGCKTCAEGGTVCVKKRETIEVSSREELKKIIDEIPEGTVYSITMEVVLTNEQSDGESE